MRHIRQLISVFLLLSGSLLRGGAENSAAADNPYAAIVDRNIFSLVSIPIPPPPETKQPDPPAKITPNGIMSIFGELQALFKVATPTKPGQPAQDKAYTLSVGERQDDIEVTRIDEVARTITFNNHGVVQEVSLTNATVTTAAAPVGASPGAPGFARPPGMPSIPVNRFGGRFSQGGNLNPTTGNNPNPSPPPNFSGNTGGNNNPQSSGESLSPEAQVIAIEVQRAQWQQQGNSASAILPPTAITPKNDEGGEPPAP